jgi:hypothetical protein
MARGIVTSFNPQMSPNRKKVLDVDARPQFGKGIIYSIEWGFRLTKGSVYQARGEYIGLTHASAKQRYFTHMDKASQLGFLYDNEKQSSAVTGSTSKGDSKLMYVSMRTSMGFKGKVKLNTDYRQVSVISEVNLFDLAHEEQKYISKYGTYDPGIGQLNSYRDVITLAKTKKKLGFNYSEGGESSKINTGRFITEREVVAAAYYFIKEGRGSEIGMRMEIGIKGENLADDIDRVFKYFKSRSGYEKMNASRPHHNRKQAAKEGKTTTRLENTLNELGLSYTKTGKVKVDGDKLKIVDMFLNVSGTPILNFSNQEVGTFIGTFLLHADKDGKTTKFTLNVNNLPDNKSRNTIINYFKSNPIFLQEITTGLALYKLESQINKKLKPKKTFQLSNSIKSIAMLNLEQAYDMLEQDPMIGGIITELRKSNKKNQATAYKKFNAGQSESEE